MKHNGTRFLACLCAAALVFSLVLAGSASADDVEIFQLAVNDKMAVDLGIDAMPIRVNGVIYIPCSVFDPNLTGINLGVTYVPMKTGSEYVLTLYSIGNTLVFDVNAGTCIEQNTGKNMSMQALDRNGQTFVPMAVCGYFRLGTWLNPTIYGTLLRIKNGEEWLSDDWFSESARSQMRTRYNEIMRSQAGQSPTPSGVTPTPAGDGPEGPDKQGVRLYLAFACTGGDGLGDILDTLERYGAHALFLFRPEELAGRDGKVRRVVGSGHAVGLLVPGETAEQALDALEQGARLLERVARIRTHTALPEGAGDAVAEELAQAGWACWAGNVDGLPDGRGQYGLSSDILDAADARRGSVRITLDDSAVSAGALGRLLPRLTQAGYSIRLAVESEL